MKTQPSVLAPLAALAAARSRNVRGIAIALALTLLLAGIGFAALLDTTLEWQPPVRTMLALGIVGSVLALLVIRWRRARQHDAKEAARLVEAAHPEIGQKLRTALEVGASAPPADGAPEGVQFRERLMQEASQDLQRLPLARLVPRKKLWKRRALAASAFAVVGIAAFSSSDFRHALNRILHPSQSLTYTTVQWTALPKSFDETHPPRVEFAVSGRSAQPTLLVQQGKGDWKPVELTRRADGQTWDVVLSGKTSDLKFKVAAGDAVQDVKTIVYRPIPKLLASEATLVFPEYTGLAEEAVAGGDVRCVEGSTGKWHFTFDHPPAKITWSIAGASPTELKPDSAAPEYRVASPISVGKATAELAIFHDDGERIDSWRFEIEGIVDKMPVVEIVEPKKDLSLIATGEMPVRIRAKDDFGVAEIGLVIDAAGERRWLVEGVIEDKQQKQVNDIGNMMLDEFDLKITDNVRIYAYALDHKPRGGPRSVSPLRAVDIKQFQQLLINGLKGGGGEEEEGGEPLDVEAVTDALKKLDEIVRLQRGIVSELFVVRESFRNNLVPEATQRIAGEQVKESALSNDTNSVAMDWHAAGDIPADDVALLDTAGTQMAEADLFLRTPDLTNGFATADRALSTLLQLRKELISMIMKGKKGGKPMEGPPPPPMTDLAKEARRIAGEEHDIAGQVAPEAVAGNDIKASRRQQEVALADTGELFAKLVDHPERTDGSLQLMDEAEKEVATADLSLNRENPVEARPDLLSAEQRLLDLAIFLESMDLEKLSETLRKLAENAEKAAAEQEAAEAEAKAEGKGEEEGEGEGKGEGKGQGQGQGEGEGKPEMAENEPAKEGEGEKPEAGDKGEQAAKERQGEPKGGEGHKPSEVAARAAEEAAARTELADKILEELSKMAQGAQVNPEAPKSPRAAALEGLQNRTDLKGLAGDLNRLAEMKKSGGGEGEAALQDETAGRLGAMAREFREAAASLDASRLAELNRAREEAEKLKEDLAAKEEGKGEMAANGKGEGQGEKPGEGQGQGQGQGEKPGQGEGQGKGETAGTGKGEGQGEKPGEGQGKGQGEKPGQGEGQGKGEMAANGQGQGQGKGEGQGMGEGEEGKGSGGGKTTGGGGRPRLNEFADVLAGLSDGGGLGSIIDPLRVAPFDRSTIPLVDAAATRIDELIAEIPVTPGVATAAGKLPEASRREIEDYFRDLSDDFGDEVWEKKQ